ncbi:MAG TPA: flagellar hook-basal body complex protein FliE [Thermotogota bacterium]|nr:flagellar hook-basal body complex protein FliE [Thermotogota bacterium]
MSNGIDPINSLTSLDPIKRLERIQNTQASQVKKGEAEPDFQKILNDALKSVNVQQKDAIQAEDDFAAGKISNIHDVIIRAEKAAMSLTMTMEVRNKIVDAYKEIMRMQL